MKIKGIFLFAFALFTLASCSDSSVDNSSSTGVENAQGYLSLNLASSTEKSEASANYLVAPAAAGAENDSKIHSVTILLVGPKGSEKEGKIISVFPKATYSVGSTPSLSNSLRVHTGKYEVFAVVNPSGKVEEALVVDNNIERVFEIANSQELEGYTNSQNGFLMINERTSDNGTGGVPVEVTVRNTNNNPAKASVKVDRIVASLKITSTVAPEIKFDYKLSDNTSQNIIVSAQVEGFYPLYTRKSFNLIQKWTSMGSSLVLENAKALVSGKPDASDFLNKPEDILEYDKDGFPISSKLTNSDFVNSAYVLENRPEILEVDSLLTSYNVGTTAVIFKVTALNTENKPQTFYKVSQSNKYFIDLKSAIQERNELFEDQLDLATEDAATLRKNGIRVYQDGAMYYTYYIKDKSRKYKSSEYMSVYRNTSYQLSVNNIYTVGSDLPASEIDPNNPDPIIDTYISVSVSVNDWILNIYDIDL